MDRLECVVKPYAWGSREAIAELLGRAPPGGPEAELWMGAHPDGASCIGGASIERSIALDPAEWLGSRVAQRFGRLPFLFKVLAAAAPLSIQAHPTEAQAVAGFAEEDARGVQRDAPTRRYRDASAKPELLVALSPFIALAGFVEVDVALARLELLHMPTLEPLITTLAAERSLARAVRVALGTKLDAAATAELGTRATALAKIDAVFTEIPGLTQAFPGDPGVLVALLLHLVTLAPGDALYLPAGQLHAYVRGTGLEIMASSDNVLRGGLTPKLVDVEELARILDARPARPRRVQATTHGREERYETEAREFELSRIALGAEPFAATVEGPEILLVLEGTAELDGHPAPRGQAFFVRAAERAWSARAWPADGAATLVRVRVP